MVEDGLAQAPDPVGGEIQVNTYTTNIQEEPSIATDNNGNFVIAWHSDGQDGSGKGVYAQRYNSSGVVQGSEFPVNTFTTGDQSNPSVAMDSDGDFVITWESGGNQDGSGYGIYSQRYNAVGVTQGSEFQVNTSTTDHQRVPSIAMDSDGDFVICWRSGSSLYGSNGVFAQRYNAAGVPQGSEFQVNTFTTIAEIWRYSVAMDNDGDFVIAWASYGQDEPYNNGIYAQRYNAAGVPQGSEFQVNTYTTSFQSAPSIAMDSDGDFAIAWHSYNQDGSFYGIYAQRYNAAGEAQGAEFQVSTYTTSAQSAPSIAMDSQGDFVITWQSLDQDGSEWGIYAQSYNVLGEVMGTEFQVNTYTSGDQDGFFGPSIAMDVDGDFVIAWRSRGQDGSSFGIFAQRYSPPSPPTPVGTEFQVNTYATSYQSLPSIAMDNNGDFVIAWQGVGNNGFAIYAQRYAANGSPQENEFQVNADTNKGQTVTVPSTAMDSDGDFVITWELVTNVPGYGIYAQRYNAAGEAQGSEFQVNTNTTSGQSLPAPSIAMDNNGDFVIAWHSQQDGSSYGIYAQRYNASGVAQGSEFQVNSYTTSYQMTPSIAMDNDGDFVITWSSGYQDGSSYGVYAQRYDAAGVAQGAEFQVNTYTTSYQSFPSIAIDSDGDFVIAWVSGGQDGSYNGVYAQRYNAAGTAQGAEFQVNTYTTNYRIGVQ